MAHMSTQQLIDQNNAWAAEQNRNSGYKGTNYMMMKYDPVTGNQTSYTDPLRKQADIAGFTPSTEAGSTMWSSAYPGSAFWSPTKGGAWQEMDESMLSNPDAARAVMSQSANTSSPAYGTWSALKSKIDPNVIKGIEGSTSSLAPEVLSKMWSGGGGVTK